MRAFAYFLVLALGIFAMILIYHSLGGEALAGIVLGVWANNASGSIARGGD